ELLMQLLDAVAQRSRLIGKLCRSLLEQIGDADRDDGAVDRPPRSIRREQLEEPAPLRAVALLVALLRCVTTRSVQQDGFVGEPPVAVARTADAADGLVAKLVGEWELQPGIDQRGGLARSRGADEDVPGQIIEVLSSRERK